MRLTVLLMLSKTTPNKKKDEKDQKKNICPSKPRVKRPQLWISHKSEIPSFHSPLTLTTHAK